MSKWGLEIVHETKQERESFISLSFYLSFRNSDEGFILHKAHRVNQDISGCVHMNEELAHSLVPFRLGHFVASAHRNEREKEQFYRR